MVTRFCDISPSLNNSYVSFRLQGVIELIVGFWSILNTISSQKILLLISL